MVAAEKAVIIVPCGPPCAKVIQGVAAVVSEDRMRIASVGALLGIEIISVLSFERADSTMPRYQCMNLVEHKGSITDYLAIGLASQ